MTLLRGRELSDIISRRGKRQTISECPEMNCQRTRGTEDVGTVQQSTLASMHAGK